MSDKHTQAMFQNVPLSQITVAHNTRTQFDEKDLQELTDSIRAKGVLQPVLLRPLGKNKYELVCGGRRFKAAQAIAIAIQSRDTIPATIREMSADEALELQIIENLQRKDVHPLDEAVAFSRLRDERQMTIEDIALKVAKSKSFVINRLQLDNLHDHWKRVFYEGRISWASADRLSKFPQLRQLDHWSDHYAESDEHITLNDYVFRKMSGSLDLANWPLDAENVGGVKVSCANCPKSSLKNPELFQTGDFKAESNCLDIGCYQTKGSAASKLNVETAKAEGLAIVTGYNTEKIAADLKKDGMTVYGYHDYQEIEMPVKEDYIDNVDREDYETEKEYQDALKEAEAEFAEELADYEKEVASPGCQKVLKIDNDKCYFIQAKIKVKGAKTTSGKGGDKAAGTGDDTEELIFSMKNEIAGIKERGKRNDFLTECKCYDEQYASYITSLKKLVSDKPLRKVEMVMAILMLGERSPELIRLTFSKHTNVGSHSYISPDKKLKIAEQLMAKKESVINAIFTQMVRAWVIEEAKNPKEHVPSNSAYQWGMKQVMMEEAKESMDKIQATYTAKQEKSSASREARITGLNKKIKEMKKPVAAAATGAKEAPKPAEQTKGIDVLIKGVEAAIIEKGGSKGGKVVKADKPVKPAKQASTPKKKSTAKK